MRKLGSSVACHLNGRKIYESLYSDINIEDKI